MRRLQFMAAFAGLALVAGTPAEARKKAPPPPPAPVIPQVRTGDAGIDAWYFYDRHGAPLWTASDAGRQAAARVIEVLKRAPIDGLAEGPVLAATVEAALAAGTLDGDAAISTAWMKYVRTVKAPVAGIEYGDPALTLKVPTPKEALGALAAAPSMATAVDATARVNAFYASLRETALDTGSQADPHVKATLERLRAVPDRGKLILVDTASQRLMMIEDGTVVGTMKVVVGKAHSPTHNIAGTINYVTLNPYWNIPLDIVKRRVAPLVIKRGSAYLTAARYVTTERWGVAAERVDPDSIDWKAVAAGDKTAYLRQMPGPNNMMGKMKFGFVNSGDIFLHDTPRKALFDKPKRNLSNGCVRLEKASELARWITGTEPVVGDDAPEQQVRIMGGIPVYTLALTAFAGSDGKIAFADDVYGYDDPATAAHAGAALTQPVADDGN
ncbi:MAG: L,D-transpeptidase family protein [Sphingomicrobium sp.]